MITKIRTIVLLLVFGAVASNVAAETVRKAPDPARDQRQTMDARRLLVQDPELVPFNIGVIVQDRVAILWGPVPSAEVAFRAELCLRTMVELAEVRNELMVNELLEPIRRPLKMELPAPMLPELLPPVLPKDVRSKPGSAGVLTGQDHRATSKIPAGQTAGQVKKQAAESQPGDTAARVKPGNDAAEPDLTKAIRALLQRSPAFASVQFTVQGSRVYLRSSEPNPSDTLQAAARIIARMPNVAGVIVLD